MSLYLIFHFSTQGKDFYTKQEKPWPSILFVLIKKKERKEKLNKKVRTISIEFIRWCTEIESSFKLIPNSFNVAIMYCGWKVGSYLVLPQDCVLI